MVRARPASSLLKRFLAASPASSSAGSARATFVSPTAFAFCPSDSCSSLLAIRGRSPLPLRSPGGLVCGARIGLAIAVQRGHFSSSSFSRASANSSARFPQEEAEGGGASEEDNEAFDDPRLTILDASLNHVEMHGFSATALAAGAKDCGFHSVATGMFPRGAVELVHHVMAKALEEVKLLSRNDDAPKKENRPEDASVSGDKEGMGGDGISGDGEGWEEADGEVERLRKGMRAGISSVARYREHWPHAMSIGALPQNAGATATAVGVLADELAFLGGDRSTDLAWYGKRGLIAGIYASTELFMLTDDSEGLSETWSYLDRRLLDYETLVSSPDNAQDLVTGAGTVATSLSSAVIALAGPFLRQASKQVPGAQTLSQTAPNVANFASQAISFVASQVPHAQPPFVSSNGSSGSRTAPPSDTEASEQTPDQPPTFPGAPERDPWSETPGSGASKPGEFEKELAREEKELFGGSNK